MVGDGAAGGHDGVGGRALDLVVHLQLGAQPAHALEGKVRCRSVGIDVTSNALKPLVQQIKNEICQSEYAHFDETKYSINGSTGWIWVATNNDSCFITVENSRGRNVLEKHFESFSGVAVCDGWRPYHIFNTRQRCWAHILREAKHNAEKLDTVSSVLLYKSLQKLFADTTSHKIERSNYFLYDSAVLSLEQIITSYSNDESLNKFLIKLHNAKNNLFTFLLHDAVDPTNNKAERALRESVIHRKVRGCVRNQKGCKMFGNLMSCIMTWKMRNYNLLDEIVKYV